MQTPGLYDPRGVESIVNALRRPQGTQVAGDVVNMPWVGLPPNIMQLSHDVQEQNMGPTNKSADYAWGNRTDPKVGSIGTDKLYEWMSRNAQMLKARANALGYGPTGGVVPTQGPWPPGSGGNLPPKM